MATSILLLLLAPLLVASQACDPNINTCSPAFSADCVADTQTLLAKAQLKGLQPACVASCTTDAKTCDTSAECKKLETACGTSTVNSEGFYCVYSLFFSGTKDSDVPKQPFCVPESCAAEAFPPSAPILMSGTIGASSSTSCNNGFCVKMDCKQTPKDNTLLYVTAAGVTILCVGGCFLRRRLAGGYSPV